MGVLLLAGHNVFWLGEQDRRACVELLRLRLRVEKHIGLGLLKFPWGGMGRCGCGIIINVLVGVGGHGWMWGVTKFSRPFIGVTRRLTQFVRFRKRTMARTAFLRRREAGLPNPATRVAVTTFVIIIFKQHDTAVAQ